MKHSTLKILAVTAAVALAVGCSATQQSTAEQQSAVDTVTIVVHEHFPNEEFAAAASEATGLKVEVINAGGGDDLSSQLVLTKDAPIADAFFGVNNFFAPRLLTADAVVPYGDRLPAGAERFAYDEATTLVPVTDSAVCLNTDPAWFAAKGLVEPETYADLVKPEYKGLTVAIDPAGSSTGIAFLAGTIAAFGESEYLSYWEQLKANEVRIEQGWSEAYQGQFTQGGENGSYPIVVSYASSPAWTVTEDGAATTTRALLDTCSSMVEYAGILKGTDNEAGARKVIAYMLSKEFQDTVAETMYVYPVITGATVPAEWQQFAPTPETRHDLDAAEIGANRDAWLRELETVIHG